MFRTLRQFLVVQAFMLWQGGFVFYSGVVVPLGTDVHGQFEQGLVTQRVTDWLNVIGLIWHVVFAWELRSAEGFRRTRGVLWAVSLVALFSLFPLHIRLDRMLDAGEAQGEARFYQWHAVYLGLSTFQWVLALVQLWLTLRFWAKGQSRGDAASLL